MEKETSDSECAPPARVRRWLKPLLAAGFLFFLIKGLAWLAVLAGAVFFTTR